MKFVCFPVVVSNNADSVSFIVPSVSSCLCCPTDTVPVPLYNPQTSLSTLSSGNYFLSKSDQGGGPLLLSPERNKPGLKFDLTSSFISSKKRRLFCLLTSGFQFSTCAAWCLEGLLMEKKKKSNLYLTGALS